MGEYLIEKLNRFNLKLYARTDSDIVNQGKTIYNWLQKHLDVKHYIILDDNVYDYEKYNLMDHLVYLSFHIGLQYTHIEECIKKVQMDF